MQVGEEGCLVEVAQTASKGPADKDMAGTVLIQTTTITQPSKQSAN